MERILKLIRLELFVLSKDTRVRIKLCISFLLIVYVLSYSLFEESSNILPFFYFGFFFASPLIDYSFFTERLSKRFSLLIGKGFSLREIITAKSLTVFLTGLTAGIFFTAVAFYLDRSGLIYSGFETVHLKFFVTIALYNYLIIVFSGVIQTRFEMIFPVRLLNIAGFLLFVNFQNEAADLFLSNLYILQVTTLLILSGLTLFVAGRLNKDKIA